MFEEYKIFHHKFVEWFRYYNHKISDELLSYQSALENLINYSDNDLKDLIQNSPYYKSTSEDIDWVSKVKMQGRVQKWVDHSISCTVNIPKEATEQLVGQIYMTAWESKCKGITIYRESSRDGILISTSKNKKIQNIRPDSIDAKVVRFMNGNEKWIAFIGMMNDRPYEIFSGLMDDDIKHLPKSITNGKIIRIKIDNDNKRYDFQYDVGFGYKNYLPNIGQSFNPEYYNYARFVSTLLREDIDLLKIINTLDGLDSGNLINVWNKGVSRALKSFIKDGTISMQNCEHCPGCGYSKCE
jgi:ribonucleoside-diphosphate reductase alpha chain